MARGIRDKVAIIGMGCSKFGERWDSGAEDLMVEAFNEALEDAGIEKSQIEAGWFGSAFDKVHVGPSALPMATTLRLSNIPITRVENMCATGHGGPARCDLCGRVGRLRHCHGAGR